MPDQMKPKDEDRVTPTSARGGVKLEIYGEEIVEKIVKLSGSSGRIYLPMVWVGRRVKIVRLN
jgi:putative transposon-encoded protein